MADRKAQQKYYPPEWDPSKGSINTFRGSHHLRQRASKLKTEGILVVRCVPFSSPPPLPSPSPSLPCPALTLAPASRCPGTSGASNATK